MIKLLALLLPLFMGTATYAGADVNDTDGTGGFGTDGNEEGDQGPDSSATTTVASDGVPLEPVIPPFEAAAPPPPVLQNTGGVPIG
jgi:hypothetical protein